MSKKLDQPIIISITFGAVFKVIVAVLIFYFIFTLRDLFLILLTAVILASAIEPITKFFISKKIPRIISVVIIYTFTITVFGFIFYVFVPPLVKDMTSILNTLPGYLTEITQSERLNNIPIFTDLISRITNDTTNPEFFSMIGRGAGSATANVVATFSLIFGGFVSAVLIIVFSFYLSVQEDGVSNLIRLLTPIKNEKYAIDLWKRSQRKIGLWMQGQLLLSILIAVLTYLSLSIFGIQNALFLALIAGIFELIPIFGPILASIPAIIFALLQGGIPLALIIIFVYIIIQQFESQLIHPLVVKKIVGIPALIAILALIIGSQLAGFLGILISVPVTAAIMEYINDVEKNKLKQMKESQ